jgi:molecular chaperone Hsp33
MANVEFTDELHSFVLGDGGVRGAVVRLASSWHEVQARRAYPPSLQQLLGEMLAGVSLMASTIKFDGSLVLQMMGEGALSMAVAECQPGMGLRATAKWHEPFEAGSLEAMLGRPVVGATRSKHAPRCVITLDPLDKSKGQQAYQGVVPLHGDDGRSLASLKDVLELYMLRSEQLDTRFVLACDARTAAGVLIQRMPVTGGTVSGKHSDLLYEDASIMLASLKADELLSVEPQTIARRLFWQQGLRVWSRSGAQSHAPHFSCTCSREKVRNMLQMLGRDEVESIIAERGEVEVSCDFCGATYQFDPVDAAQALLSAQVQPPGTSTSH